MNIEDVVQVLVEEAGFKVLGIEPDIFGGRVIVQHENQIKKIGINGTQLFVCGKGTPGEKCDHGVQHSVSLEDPDSFEIIRGWFPWFDSLN